MSARESHLSATAILVLAASCLAHRASLDADAPERAEHHEPNCLPFGTKKPVRVPGDVCGDGIAGGPCEEIEVHSCHAEENKTMTQCQPWAEICDGNDLRGQTCESVGLSGKGLACRVECNDFVTTACDRCPRRPGVQCSDLKLPPRMSAFRIAETAAGDLAVLGISDTDMAVSFHLRSRQGTTKTVALPADRSSRHLAAAGPATFLIGAEDSMRQFVVTPLSVQGRVGAAVPVPTPRGSYEFELLGASDRAWLVTRPGWQERVTSVTALSEAGAVVPLSTQAPTVVGSIVLQPTEAGVLTVELKEDPRDNSRRADGGFDCVVEATLPDGGVVMTGDFGPWGTLSLTQDVNDCQGTWTQRDGGTAPLRSAGLRAPAMVGVDGWTRTPTGWLGHRMGTVLAVDRASFGPLPIAAPPAGSDGSATGGAKPVKPDDAGPPIKRVKPVKPDDAGPASKQLKPSDAPKP